MNLAVLDTLRNPGKEDLKKALLMLDCRLENVMPELGDSNGKPYYRKLLFKNDEVELLVMNWSGLECAPHDHGDSHGWIQVLSGVSKNTVYEAQDGYFPRELFEELYDEGRLFFAPRNGVHKMKAEGGKGLVTLHLYSPPITGMKVFDLQTCAVCVVSDDCGAWWPEDQRQKVREIQLGSPENS